MDEVVSKMNSLLFNKFKQLDKRFTKDKINSCLVHYQGDIVYEFYRNNKMKDKLHKVNSVTKSLLSILIGIAIDKGYIKGINQSIGDFFSNLDGAKAEIKIGHLLTMTPGYDWPEFGSWGGRPMPMINSKDWVKFVLERKMVDTPGENMYYNSGASHLLSAILQKATGQPGTQFADHYLFHPLGITEYDWYFDSKGIVIGGFGLSLKAEDMLKIGRLMLEKGRWGGRSIISESWIKESTVGRYLIYRQFGYYGYHWWVLDSGEGDKETGPQIFFAMGYGGQYIIVAPTHQLIVVFTSDNYGDPTKPLNYFKNDIILNILKS
jgi:CubicO group peptidase (beta-lactamase class C family)